MWIEKGECTIPQVPDLEGLNLSVVEWLEEVIQEYPRGGYLNSEECFEEEDDHWTAIARSLSQQQLDENLAYVALGKTEGAELACGGDRLTRDTDGYFMAPGVFLNTTNDMRINREEMFAPLAAVIKVDSYSEALHVVNDTHFGLTSGIVTRSLSRATHFRRNARTGCVMVNLPTAGTDYHVPFGGRGDSSYGTREQGTYAAEFYTTVKTAYIASGTPE